MTEPTEIDLLAARDVVGDEIVQHLQLMLATCTTSGNGTHNIPSEHIDVAKVLMDHWRKNNRAFEAAIRKKGR